jgi:hypothetical protein
MSWQLHMKRVSKAAEVNLDEYVVLLNHAPFVVSHFLLWFSRSLSCDFVRKASSKS